jgi:hypothetical protein
MGRAKACAERSDRAGLFRPRAAAPKASGAPMVARTSRGLAPFAPAFTLDVRTGPSALVRLYRLKGVAIQGIDPCVTSIFHSLQLCSSPCCSSRMTLMAYFRAAASSGRSVPSGFLLVGIPAMAQEKPTACPHAER